MNTTRNRNNAGSRRSQSPSNSYSRRNSTSRNNRNGGGRQNKNKRNNGGRNKGRNMPTFNPTQFINSNPVEVKQEVYTATNSFEDFNLHEKLARNITTLKIITPSPIQDKIIPEILNNRDVIGLAETGTGKTAAFLIPLIENTIKNNRKQTLILTPTRELAMQIEEEFLKLSYGFRLHSVLCVGGVNIQPQIKALQRHNHFVIGTPGRILDLIKRKNFKPITVTTVVLDEADRMLDMGFIHDIKNILSTTPRKRETLLFSATMKDNTKDIVNNFLNNSIKVSVKKKDVIDSIEQGIVKFEHKTKLETLEKLLDKPEFKRVIVFGAMKHSVEKLSKQLSKKNIRSESIHGNKSHGQRQRALNNFKNGRARVLVATDVAARGIHVDNVTHVINYDLPNTFEDYVHRIGRTGRSVNRGKALTFVAEKRS